MAYRVTLIPGDGTGPEQTEATRRVLESTGVDFEGDVQPAGAEVMDRHGGNPLPESTLESIRRNGIALEGPITTPIGEGFRSVNVGRASPNDMKPSRDDPTAVGTSEVADALIEKLEVSA